MHTAPFRRSLLQQIIVTSASFKDSLFTKVEGGKSDIQYSSAPISNRSPHETIFHSLCFGGAIKKVGSFVPLNAGG